MKSTFRNIGIVAVALIVVIINLLKISNKISKDTETILVIVALTIIFSLFVISAKGKSKSRKSSPLIAILIITSITFAGCAKKVYPERFQPKESEVKSLIKDTLSAVVVDYEKLGSISNRFEIPEEDLVINIVTFISPIKEENHVWFFAVKNNPKRPVYSEKFSRKNLNEFYVIHGRGYFYHVYGNCYVRQSLKEDCIYFNFLLLEGIYRARYTLKNLDLYPIGSLDNHVDPIESRELRK